MTLILTRISPQGIVHVSDSVVSYADLSRAGLRERKPYKKLFKAKRLPIGVACAGVYDLSSVGMSMAEWIPARIGEYETDGGTTVRGLADFLGRSLERDLIPAEMKRGSWLHVAGYTPDGDGWQAEMYVVSNVPSVGDWVSYPPGQLWFRKLKEEYRTPRNPTPDGQPPETDDPVGLWFNGFPAGRIVWEAVRQLLDGYFLPAVWNQCGWELREPRTLREWAIYLSLHLSIVTHLFQMSEYRGPIIGGRTQRLLIPPPRRRQRRTSRPR